MIVGVRPLLSALRRSPAGPSLMAVQVAVTLAVFANVAGIVARRVGRIEQPPGINTRDTFVIVVGSQSKQFHVASAVEADLAYLRAQPGVAAATVTGGEPFIGDGENFPFWTRPDRQGRTINVSVMPTDDQGLRTLGVPLISGRNFRPGEIVPISRDGRSRPVSSIILTKFAAQTLFPHGSAAGETVYGYGGSPYVIDGVTRNFMGPQLGQPRYATALWPEITGASGQYELLVRTRGGRLDAVMRAAKHHIGMAHPDAVILSVTKLSHDLRHMQAKDRNVAVVLVSVTAAMLAICCFGIFALATFNVARRTRQIGVRRAVGARRRDIIAYFMTESTLVVTAGMAVGSGLALAFGQWLSDHYGMHRLDPWYVLAGIIVLGLIAQLSTLGPARRAALIPPSVATRSV